MNQKHSPMAEHERQQNDAAIDGLINDAAETISKTHKTALPASTPDLHTHAPGLLLSDVTAQQVHWLWPQRLPLGHLTLLEGLSGIGTSLLATALAACVSSGSPLPDDTGTACQQGAVILVVPHDHAPDLIKPRFLAARGDPSQVLLLTTVERLDPHNVKLDDRPFSLSEDLDLLEAHIQRLHALLVIIDPLTAVLGYPTGSSRRWEERRVLSRLAHLAQHNDCAILLVRPLSKQATATTLRSGGSGSLDLITAVRSRLLLLPDPNDEESLLLVTTKHTFSQPPITLSYQVTAKDQHTPTLLYAGDHPGPISAVLNPGSDSPLSEMRQNILELLHDHPIALNAMYIRGCVGTDYEALRKMLQRMHHAGQVVSPARGLYTTPDHPCLAEYPNGPLELDPNDILLEPILSL